MRGAAMREEGGMNDKPRNIWRRKPAGVDKRQPPVALTAARGGVKTRTAPGAMSRYPVFRRAARGVQREVRDASTMPDAAATPKDGSV